VVGIVPQHGVETGGEVLGRGWERKRTQWSAQSPSIALRLDGKSLSVAGNVKLLGGRLSARAQHRDWTTSPQA